jgi:glutamine kinase
MEFISKSDTLKTLQKLLQKSKIEKIYDFSVLDWHENQGKILKEISNNFKSKIIIRSSAIGEDSINSSEAGSYQSILNIPSNSKNKTKSAINSIISSYNQKGNFNKNNKILIQNQTLDVIMSGVIFTKTEDKGAPYYIINYDDGKYTDTVTKGEINKVVKIFRNSKEIDKKFRKIIESIKEIEKIVKLNSLDIEFAVTKLNKVVIFQVRPITFLKNFESVSEKEIKKIIEKNKKKYLKIIKSLGYNSKNIFSDMADWNPSEIIGNNPNLLDYTLYDFLLLKSEWREGRKVLGYQDTSPKPLMYKFGNKPYIDIIASFNSMIPSTINNKLKKKLLKYYLEKLKKNHELHDKVEFEILFSCYDFTIKKRLKELKKNGFSIKEIKEIKKAILKLTNNVFVNFPNISNNAAKSIENLSENRIMIQKESKKSNQSYYNYLETAEKLLNDCKKNGTLPFSTMARIAFIGTIILKSLVKLSYVNIEYYENLMLTLKTPLSKLKNEYDLYSKKKISKKEFLEKFGHLRPGTYDITATRYDKKNDYFENVKFLKKGKKEYQKKDEIKIDFSKYGLKIESHDFEEFLKKSLTLREELKFEFTRNLSDSLELISKAGKDLGLKREEMANLDIKSIFKDYKILSKKDLIKKWKNNSNQQIVHKKMNEFLILPPIIKTKEDFENIQYYYSKPNFISSKKIVGEVVNIKNNLQDLNIQNKIVLLENADPGYDWLFTKNLRGLITKYGGVASHMAIRCSEVGIPAAIGCGEIIFEKLILSSEIMLDCKNQQIITLKEEEIDEFMEEKKVLKALGYIK